MRRLRRALSLACLVSFCLSGLAGLGLAAEPAGGDREAIAVAAQGYLSNRESFPTIRCRFRAVRAKAHSVDDAIKGDLVGDQIVHEGLWLVNGAKVKHELVCKQEPRSLGEITSRPKIAKGSSEDKAATPKAERSSVAVPCASRFVLRDGSYTLTYSPLILGANLFPIDMKDPAGIRLTPFGMDIMGPDEMVNPGRVLQDCLGGMFSGTFDGAERVRGTDTLAYTALYKSGNPSSVGKPAYRFLLDPRRGYLPIHTWGTRPDTAKKTYEAYITHVRACSRDRWFPERSVVVLDIGGKGPFTVDEIKVLELDVDNAPLDQDFFLSLRAKTQVNVETRPEWVTIQDDERIGVDDLPRLHQRCIEHGKMRTKQSELAKPAEPKPAPDNRLRWIVTTVAGCVLAVAVVWSVFRWRRPKAR